MQKRIAEITQEYKRHWNMFGLEKLVNRTNIRERKDKKRKRVEVYYVRCYQNICRQLLSA